MDWTNRTSCGARLVLAALVLPWCGAPAWSAASEFDPLKELQEQLTTLGRSHFGEPAPRGRVFNPGGAPVRVGVDLDMRKEGSHTTEDAYRTIIGAIKSFSDTLTVQPGSSQPFHFENEAADTAIDVVVSDAAGREVIRQKSDGPVGVREMKLDWSGLPVEEYSCAVAARSAGGAEIPVTDGRITVTLKPETFVLVAAVERERVGNHRPPRLGRSVLAVMTYRTDKSHSSDKSYWPDAGNRRAAVLSDAMPLPGVVPGIPLGTAPCGWLRVFRPRTRLARCCLAM